MAVVDPTQLVWDGYSSVESGMNNGAAPNRLPPLQAALLINATARGNFATQRPGFRRVMTVLQTPPGMFQHFGEFLTDSGRQYLVVVCNGQFYRVDPIAKTVAEITIPGDRNPSNLRRGWSVHAETFWIYNDGQTLPFIWTGGSARRAGKGEIQPGTVIAYVQGRLWYALPDGLGFRATDLVGNQDSGTPAYRYRDSILHETENDFLNEGGDFRVPANCGEITAMAATSILDTSQGQGPLQVLCKLNGFSVNTPVDRTIWKNVTYPIQTESLIGAGCSGAQNTINVNGDLFFRAPDGLRSFIIARRQFRDYGNTPQSFEMSGFFDADQPDLLTFGSSAIIGNRFVTTISPVYSAAGVYHNGLAVVDLAPITTMQGNSPPVYDGLWTGLKILAVRQTVGGVYLLVLEEDGGIALWQMTTDEKFDDIDGRIQWTVVPRTLFVERDAAGRPVRQLRKLRTADLEYDQLAGLVEFKASWQPDAYPCPTVWAQWEDCVPNCFTEFDCTKPLVFQTGYMPRKRLPEPPEQCAEGAALPLANFYSLNVRLDVTGPARLLSARYGATNESEPKYEPNICEPPICVPIQCCGFDPFSYTSKGSSGGGGSGSGSGSGGSGGGGGSGAPTPPEPPIPPGPTPIPPGPSWPVLPEFDCGDVPTNYFGPIEVHDQVTGNNRFVGIAPGSFSPPDYMTIFGQPGATEAWAAELWRQFLAAGITYSQARISWHASGLTDANFMAIQVFPGMPGGYSLVIELDYTLVVEYCP